MPTATAPWGSCNSASTALIRNYQPFWFIPASKFRCCRISAVARPDAGSMSAGCWKPERGSKAIDAGADIVIINRFGKQDREGKGLAYPIERALDADIPVVIAVPSHRFADWIRFASGMSVKLACDRASLDGWWRALSRRNAGLIARDHFTVCEAFK
jgi:hypothetical protein